MKQLQVKLYGHWHNVEYWFEGPKNIHIEDIRTHEIISTPTDDKPEPPHEHKWLHNKWRTEYLSHCALDMLCNPHEFEPKLDTKFKYHVCQKCGIVISDAEKKAEFYQCKSYYDKPTEPYKCPSYYDNNNQLQDCTCGKCGKSSVEPTQDKPEKIEPIEPYVRTQDTGNGHFLEIEDYDNKQMGRKINQIIDWINNHERREE